MMRNYFICLFLLITNLKVIAQEMNSDKLNNLGWHGIYSNLNVSVLEMGKQSNIYKEENRLIRETKKKDNRIVFFGNSITQNWSVFTDFFKKIII